MSDPTRVKAGEGHVYRQEQMIHSITIKNVGATIPVVQFNNGKMTIAFPDCSIAQLGGERPYSLFSRTQVALVAAWAMTVHKAQGMTMDKMVVNFVQDVLLNPGVRCPVQETHFGRTESQGRRKVLMGLEPT
ncbi:hypothetical protein LTR37_004234 [Vermiconidia calcicola]|uniref:Uncharacterized protein n=1 Tax=Vermiconidia calcicola TaxID=1690605 RepID=A0ACC3NP36_9PEZI|nr:hypothetical protein LTR37_004234 [Vermiconidia calcicola]